MAKMGRPTDNPAKRRVSILLTEEQYGKLEKCAKSKRWTYTDVIRDGIDRVYANMSEDEK